VLRKLCMLGPVPETVKAKFVLAICLSGLLLAVGGCFWRSYPARLRTHTDLLVAFARKARDLVATGRFTAENLPELTYPLERAAAFAAETRQRAAPPPQSLVAFEGLIERYRTFVDLVDQGRRGRGDPVAAAAALKAPLESVQAAAEDVTAALTRERDAVTRAAGASPASRP